MRRYLRKAVFFTFGWLEITIGLVTFVGCIAVQVWGLYDLPPKEYTTYVFVIVAAGVSFILGMGLLRLKEWARRLLIFFSILIMTTKVLIYFGLISFDRPAVTIVPVGLKDTVSFIYHAALAILLFFFWQK